MGTNSVCIQRVFAQEFPLFPDGRTRRGGDRYAWVHAVAKAGGLAWSPHIASISYRNTENMVSRTELPSLTLYKEMVFELQDHLAHYELSALKKYVNRLQRGGLIEYKVRKAPCGSYSQHFLWKDDVVFSLFWTCVLRIPGLGALLIYLKQRRH